jgi:hypothetical protein
VQAAKLAKDFNKTLIRARTKMFYKQQKFNLLHEEAEGSLGRLALH